MRIILSSSMALCALLASCGVYGASLPSIDLARHGGDWRVTYTLDTPAKELRFAREDAQGHRAQLWTPVDAEVQISLESGAEVVRRRDGADFTTLAFDMAPRYVTLEKDYAPFSPFSDGGTLIHTGRFFACAPRCDDDALQWSMTITPPPGSHVIHDGALSREPVRYVDRDSGTNVYVGAAEPVENSHVVAVIDPAFPELAREQLSRLFPRLMDYYADRLGVLAQKPMLFASNDRAHPGGGFGHQGGTLPGQVFVHLYGPRRDDDPVQFAAAMSAFFAHEAAHLYQRYDAADDQSAAWIHEGGADAMAVLALTDLELLDAAARRARVQGALDDCAAGVKGHALRESAVRGSFDTYYHCGMLMQLAVDAAARRRDPACDLFCVWRAYFERIGKGETWSSETFAAAVDDRADRATGDFVRAAAAQAHEDPAAFFRAGLRDAGVEVP